MVTHKASEYDVTIVIAIAITIFSVVVDGTGLSTLRVLCLASRSASRSASNIRLMRSFSNTRLPIRGKTSSGRPSKQILIKTVIQRDIIKIEVLLHWAHRNPRIFNTSSDRADLVNF